MIDDTRQLIFVHPEKSGGTTIEKAFGAVPLERSKRPRGLFRPGRLLGPWNQPVIIWREQVMGADQYAERYPERWQNYRKIAIVRNPATRLISRHRYFLRCDRALLQVAGDAVQDGIWRDLLLADIRHGTHSSFGAMASQVHKLGDLSRYAFILRLESLADDWPRMLRELDLDGLPEQIGHENRSESVPVNVLDVVTDPADRAKLAKLLKPDLVKFRYTIGTVSASERDAMLKAAPKLAETIQLAYPVR